MTETPIPQTPQEAVDKAEETFKSAAKEFEALKLDTTVPESVRDFLKIKRPSYPKDLVP